MSIFARISFLIFALLAFGGFWSSFGCSEDSSPNTLGEMLLDYEKPEDLVTFTISGISSCSTCKDTDSFAGMLIDVSRASDALHSIGLYSFDSLGPFTIKDIKTIPGSIIKLHGTLYLQSPGTPVKIEGYTEFAAPDKNGEVTAVVINFPSGSQN